MQNDMREFEKYCKRQEDAETDKEELTIMEGFRYRINDTMFPVYRGQKKLEDFPIIPNGMLEIWRSETDDDFGF